MDNLNIGIFTPKNSWMFPYSEQLSNELKPYTRHIILDSELQSHHCGDIAFFLSYPQLITPAQLTQYTHNLVVHASKLPHGKGWAPASWQILEGKNTIPLSLFEATEKVDAGTIYLQEEITLNGDELIHTWQNKLAIKILELCKKIIYSYPEVLTKGQDQTGPESFYKKRTPKDSELFLNKTLDEQFNLLRIVDNDNYPAFFYKNNKKYIIKIYEE